MFNLEKCKKFLCLIFFVTTYKLSHASEPNFNLHHSQKFSGSIGIGYLAGESKEYVYDENQTVSQLNWKINRAATIEGQVNYRAWSWLSFNLRGWVLLGQGKGRMDDYDWLDPNQSHWTDWSYHDNTDLRHANEVDFSLQSRLLEKANFVVDFSAGYQRTTFSYLALGGCYQYNNQTETGCFVPHVPGIGYKQVFDTPYIGLSTTFGYNKYEANLFVRYSPWMLASDTDQHYARNLTFYEWGYESDYYALRADIGYYFKSHWKGFFAASYNRFEHARADTEIIDNDTGEREYSLNSAGLENYYYVLSLGVVYRA